MLTTSGWARLAAATTSLLVLAGGVAVLGGGWRTAATPGLHGLAAAPSPSPSPSPTPSASRAEPSPSAPVSTESTPAAEPPGSGGGSTGGGAGPAPAPTSTVPCLISPRPDCPVTFTIEPIRFSYNLPGGFCENGSLTAAVALFVSYPKTGGANITYYFSFNGVADAPTTRLIPSGSEGRSELRRVWPIPSGEFTVSLTITDPSPASTQTTWPAPSCPPPAGSNP